MKCGHLVFPTMLLMQFEVRYIERGILKHGFRSHFSNLLADKENGVGTMSSLDSTSLCRLDVNHVYARKDMFEYVVEYFIGTS